MYITVRERRKNPLIMEKVHRMQNSWEKERAESYIEEEVSVC